MDSQEVLTDFTAILSQVATIPKDFIEFKYSFGYNCKRYYNLCACDDDVVAWSAGCILTFFNTTTKQLSFRRCSTGGGIGFVTRNPNTKLKHLAVAEGGQSWAPPIIIIYEYPELKINGVLHEGTTNAYSHLDYSPDGDMLASVGCEPDFNLTVWNWREGSIIVRTSAFTNSVNNVLFSPFIPSHLTSSGASHIKFWKMAPTYTGLKLKGELGRFGKTEICNVLGIYPMPDEKVLSGCGWGNILVWEAGLVKIEVTQRNRKPCHSGPIVQFMRSADGSEITTVGMDGRICVWFWDTVEQADPPEDDPFIELNPVFEMAIPKAQIMCLQLRSEAKWFAQDGNGAVWAVDLEVSEAAAAAGGFPQERLVVSHAGAVVGMAALRCSHLLVTFGCDGVLLVYRTDRNSLIYRTIFPAPGSAMFYPHHEIDATDTTLVLGFANGILRLCRLNIEKLLLLPDLDAKDEDGLLDVLRAKVDVGVHGDVQASHSPILLIFDVVRPHNDSVTCITMEKRVTNGMVVTAGADRTIFMYGMQPSKFVPFTLQPLGYIETPHVVTFFHWKEDKERTLLIGDAAGLLVEAILPEIKYVEYDEITTYKTDFEYCKKTAIKKTKVQIKPLLDFGSEIDIDLDEEDDEFKEDKGKNEEEEQPKEIAGEVEIVIVEDSPCGSLLWGFYDCLNLGSTGSEGGSDGVWLAQEGCGCLIRIIPGEKEILKYAPIPDAWNQDITSYSLICDNRYIVLGLGNGDVRVLRFPAPGEDNSELRLFEQTKEQEKLKKKLGMRIPKSHKKMPIAMTEFLDHFRLPMHDRYNGAIRHIEFSPDSRMVFTAGDDGNIFSYTVNFPEPLLPLAQQSEKVLNFPLANPLFYDEMNVPETHEVRKQREMNEAAMAAAEKHKRRVLEELAQLRAEFKEMARSNRQLPVSQQIDEELDPRPTEELEQDLEDELALTHRKLAYELEMSSIGLKKMTKRNIAPLDVFPFTLTSIRNPDLYVRVLRQRKLSNDFYEQLNEVHVKMAEAALKARHSDAMIYKQGAKRMTWGGPRTASFLLGLPSNLPYPLFKALRWYNQRLSEHHSQYTEWQDHLSKKPDPKAMPPGAVDALREAESTIGFHRLKTDDDFVAPHGHNTQLRLCQTREEIFNIKHEFNDKVVRLREKKMRIYEKAQNRSQRLEGIKDILPVGMSKEQPRLPEINMEIEFPERNLEINPENAGQLPQVTSRRSVFFTAAMFDSIKYERFIDFYDKNPKLAKNETVTTKIQTPFEAELTKREITLLLQEQDNLLKEAEDDIELLDEGIKALLRERPRVQMKSQFLELHLLQLHQEMIVLNQFEAQEDNLMEKVYIKLSELRTLKETIDSYNARIDNHHRNIEKFEIKVNLCHVQFKRLIGDNKFADFLRKIFKRKYKRPKVTDDENLEDSESSSEESSSSDDPEAASLDSGDIGPIRLDPDYCPAGCDPTIFEQTYEMRDQRHSSEQQIIEEERAIENLKKLIENARIDGNKVQQELEKRQAALHELMRERQRRLNQIETTVVLQSSQIRADALEGVGVNALESSDGSEGLDEVLVFPERLLRSLQQRVAELEVERAEQKRRHLIMKKHLQRMNVDVAYMNQEVERLRGELGAAAKRKTGKSLRADRTLDAQLHQMARDFKLTSAGEETAVKANVNDQIKYWKTRFAELEQIYCKALEEHTEKLRLAAALQVECAEPSQEADTVRRDKSQVDQFQFQRDEIRLRRLRSNQKEQISILREEIECLQRKPCVPKPPFLPPPDPQAATPDSLKLVPEAPSPSVIPPRKTLPFSNVQLAYGILQQVTGGSEEVRSARVSEEAEGDESPEDQYISTTIDRSLMEDTASAIRMCIKSFGEDEDVAYDIIQKLVDAIPNIVIGNITRTEAIDTALSSLKDKHTETAEEAIQQLLDTLIDQRLRIIETQEPKSSLVQAVEAVRIRPSKSAASGRGSAGSQTDVHSHRVSLATTSINAMLKTILNQMPAENLETVEASDLIAASLIEEVPNIVDIVSNVNAAEIAAKLGGIGDTSPDQLLDLINRIIKTLLAQKYDAEENKEIEKLSHHSTSKDDVQNL